jgi:DNA/RNA-binding protein KIN17
MLVVFWDELPLKILPTVGTPKYLANKMKSKGLQRLRWYCQVCEKQCRDENGFKCHAQSEAHLRQMLVVGESAGRHIADFSRQFQSDFVTLLSRRCVSFCSSVLLAT